jgi:hypothetical protein
MATIYSLFPDNSVISCTLHCSDKIDRKYKSLDELLTFDNHAKHQIRSLSLTAYSRDADRGISNTCVVLLYNNRPPGFNTYVSAEGDEAFVVQVIDGLNTRFDAMRPWYAVIAKYNWLAIFLLIFSYFVTQTVRNTARSNYTPRQLISDVVSAPFSKILIVSFTLLVFCVILAAIMQLIDRIMLFVFPTGAFALGLGKQRHANKEILRTVVVIGLAMSVIGSVIATLAMR